MSRVLPILALLFLLGAPPASAQPNAGERLYRQYCSACHGPDGRGDGVVSGFLRPPPPDLTRLAQRNHGVFPTVAVIDTIDGRATPRAHGDAAMPVWGAILSAQPGDTNPELTVHSTVTQITDYLRSIQVK